MAGERGGGDKEAQGGAGGAAAAAPHMHRLELKITGMTCSACSKAIETHLKKLNGIAKESLHVDVMLGRATLIFNKKIINENQICDEVDDLGFEASVIYISHTLPPSYSDSYSCTDKHNTNNICNNSSNSLCNNSNIYNNNNNSSYSNNNSSSNNSINNINSNNSNNSNNSKSDYENEERKQTNKNVVMHNEGCGGISANDNKINCGNSTYNMNRNNSNNVNNNINTKYYCASSNSNSVHAQDIHAQADEENTTSDIILLFHNDNHNSVHNLIQFVQNMPGIISCLLLKNSRRKNKDGEEVRIFFDTKKTKIRKVFKKILQNNFHVSLINKNYVLEQSSQARGLYTEALYELLRSGIPSILVLTLAMLSAHTHMPYWLRINVLPGITVCSLLMAILAFYIQIFCGYELHLNAFQALRRGSANMSTLVSLSTNIAFWYSCGIFIFCCIYTSFFSHDASNAKSYAIPHFFDTSALLITVVLFGKMVEKRAKSKALEDLNKLLSSRPKTAILLKHSRYASLKKKIHKNKEFKEKEEEIPIDFIQIGDILKIKTNTVVPADGIIISKGSACYVNESVITGEGNAVLKSHGSLLIGGCTLTEGEAIIRTSHVGNGTVLGKIVSMVEKAQLNKCVVEETADKIAKYFVHFVLTFAVLTAVVWTVLLCLGYVTPHIPGMDLVVESADMRDSPPASVSFFISSSSMVYKVMFVMRFAVAVCAVACPCAFGLSAPTARVVAVGKAAQWGVVNKNPIAMELAENTRVIVLDKTGTISSGALQLNRMVLLPVKFCRVFGGEAILKMLTDTQNLKYEEDKIDEQKAQEEEDEEEEKEEEEEEEEDEEVIEKGKEKKRYKDNNVQEEYTAGNLFINEDGQIKNEKKQKTKKIIQTDIIVNQEKYTNYNNEVNYNIVNDLLNAFFSNYYNREKNNINICNNNNNNNNGEDNISTYSDSLLCQAEEMDKVDGLLNCFFYLLLSLESCISHPISKCITTYIKKHKISHMNKLEDCKRKITNFSSVHGGGVEGVWEGKYLIKIGNWRYVTEGGRKKEQEHININEKEKTFGAKAEGENIHASCCSTELNLLKSWVDEEQEKGNIVILLNVNGLSVGALALNDFIPHTSVHAIRYMQSKLKCEVYMCTGDSLKAARRVGASVGIADEFIAADMLPNEKLNFIEMLKWRSKEHVKRFLVNEKLKGLSAINSTINKDKLRIHSDNTMNENACGKEKEKIEENEINIIDHNNADNNDVVKEEDIPGISIKIKKLLLNIKRVWHSIAQKKKKKKTIVDIIEYPRSNNNDKRDLIKLVKKKGKVLSQGLNNISNFSSVCTGENGGALHCRRVVCMIGDGINDCPALKSSDLGICVGAANDLSLASADVVITKHNLMDAVDYIRLSKATMATIRRNFVWAGVFNGIGLPMAAGVFYPHVVLSPVVCVLIMIGSSITVITSSLLLKKQKRLQKKKKNFSLFSLNNNNSADNNYNVSINTNAHLNEIHTKEKQNKKFALFCNKFKYANVEEDYSDDCDA